MKEIFEQICQDRGYYFDYGRRDFQNLYDLANEKGKFLFFLDPVRQDEYFSEMGNNTETIYSGYFMLLLNSDFDREYDSQKESDKGNGKYEKYIKPCREELAKIIDTFNCNDLEVSEWSITEVINVFDVNADGVLVRYSIKKTF